MPTLAQPKRRRIHDRAYMARVRELPCCLFGEDCLGDVQAHNRTGAGLALKADDTETMPLCVRHHGDLEQSRGVCRSWDKSLKHDWQDAMIAWTQRRLLKTGEVF